MVAKVSVEEAATGDGDGVAMRVQQSTAARCPRCFIHNAPDEVQLCRRCTQVMDSLSETEKADVHAKLAQ